MNCKRGRLNDKKLTRRPMPYEATKQAYHLSTGVISRMIGVMLCHIDWQEELLFCVMLCGCEMESCCLYERSAP